LPVHPARSRAAKITSILLNTNDRFSPLLSLYQKEFIAYLIILAHETHTHFDRIDVWTIDYVGNFFCTSSHL